VPAIHKNRAEIREIFLRTMPGSTRRLTDEPRRLAMAARTHLRERFLRARVAISGANFAVAETGTLAVVESEGNGRMCLTLPQTLITVMGIEKLCRPGATSRSSCSCSPLLHRRADEPLHLDVGRGHPRRRAAGVPPGAARQRPDGGARRRGGPRGAALHPLLGLPQRLPGVRAHRRARLRLGVPGPDRRRPLPAADRVEDNASLPYASSLCGACYDACPVAIDIPSILVHLRAEHVEAQRRTTAGGRGL
jgi:L-lactate dehydrogenase complex protein LldF